MSDVPRSLQSWVSTIHTVVLTDDVFQLFIKSIFSDPLLILLNDAQARGHVALPTRGDWPITAMSLVLSNLQWFTRHDLRNDYPFLGWPSSLVTQGKFMLYIEQNANEADREANVQTDDLQKSKSSMLQENNPDAARMYRSIFLVEKTGRKSSVSGWDWK